MKAEDVRARLDHPVIDVDGHIIEQIPEFERHLRETLGREAAERLTASPLWSTMLDADLWRNVSSEERERRWLVATPWWGAPGNALDRATALLPGLMAQRLDDFGIDFSILYPSLGLVVAGVGESELRRGGCRALNNYLAEVTREYADRITVPATIPMETPEEALEELEHATATLGLRCAVMAGFVRRSLPGAGEASQGQLRMDTYGTDSDHDYDPVWARCQELGIAVTSHAGSMGLGFRQSTSRYMYNHIGHFGAAHEALAKSLFFGGVTRRFPKLNFAFLEGGVSWAVGLYADLIDRYHKRGGPNIKGLDPEAVDWGEFDRLLDLHGGPALADPEARAVLRAYSVGRPAELDDFSEAGLRSAEDIPERFVDRFFFGCEADDPTNVWAFAKHANPFGARLQALFGSDLGHWDVPDMCDVLPEAYEMRERELVDDVDFRDFVCDNALRLHAGMNPDFFSGTRVAAYAKDFLADRVGT